MPTSPETEPPEAFCRAAVFWRHGRTAWNAAGRLQGQSDVPLDEVGRAQAVRAAQALAAEFPDAPIVSSDLSRAWECATSLGGLTGAKPVADPSLRERSFGVWEGLGRAEISQRWPELFAAWQRGSDTTATPPGGESRAAVGERVALAVERHARQLQADQILVVVSHGAAITAAITAMMGQDPETWRGVAGLDNANWSVMVPSKAGPGWRLVGHNLGATPLRIADIFGA